MKDIATIEAIGELKIPLSCGALLLVSEQRSSRVVHSL